MYILYTFTHAICIFAFQIKVNVGTVFTEGISFKCLNNG